MPSLLLSGMIFSAGAQETAPVISRLVGTVTAVTSSQLTLLPDKGDSTVLLLSPETKVLDLPPGSTDLKAAHPGDLHEIEVGDRVLITSAAGTVAAPAAARRIIVMKSTAIVQQRESEQAGWAHSRGGTIDTIDVATGAIMMSSRGRAITVTTTPTTIFRRYVADSARFEDSKRSNISELHVGDQARVRGDGSADSVQAEEIVSGTFEQIGGSVLAVDASASTVTLNNVRTKKPVVVKVTQRTEIHQLPPQMAEQFAERSRAAGKAAPHPAPATVGTPSRPQAEGDLGQAVARLPSMPLSAIKVGGSVLLIATGDPSSPTAMTVLSDVEPILAAMENGGGETSLAPWSMSGGDAGGGNQ